MTENSIIDPKDALKLKGGHSIKRRAITMYQAVCGTCNKTVGPETENYNDVLFYLDAHLGYHH